MIKLTTLSFPRNCTQRPLLVGKKTRCFVFYKRAKDVVKRFHHERLICKKPRLCLTFFQFKKKDLMQSDRGDKIGGFLFTFVLP